MAVRAIDPKFHIEQRDGEITIVKSSNGIEIPVNEPLMLFRARDRLALPMLRVYRDLCIADGCNDFQMAGIDNRIAAFEAFQKERPEQMKQPGITRGK
jgi:hypothetical protein